MLKEDWEVSSLITGSEANVSVVELVTAVSTNLHSKGRLSMIMKPVHSRQVSSKPPSPHKSGLPAAANSGSENTSSSVEKALMLKSPPTKSTLCCTMWAWKRRGREDEGVALFGHFVVDMD